MGCLKQWAKYCIQTTPTPIFCYEVTSPNDACHWLVYSTILDPIYDVMTALYHLYTCMYFLDFSNKIKDTMTSFTNRLFVPIIIGFIVLLCILLGIDRDINIQGPLPGLRKSNLQYTSQVNTSTPCAVISLLGETSPSLKKEGRNNTTITAVKNTTSTGYECSMKNANFENLFKTYGVRNIASPGNRLDVNDDTNDENKIHLLGMSGIYLRRL